MRRLFRPTNIPAAIATIVAVLFGIFADRQNSQLFDERLRGEVLHQLNLVQTKLEGTINGDIQLARGIVAAIAIEPQMTQTRFAQIAASLLESRSEIRSIAGAPDLVVSLLYPIEGN